MFQQEVKVLKLDRGGVSVRGKGDPNRGRGGAIFKR